MAIARRTRYLSLLAAITVCIAFGGAVRVRYATEIVGVQNGHGAVEVTDRWSGSHMLCEP